MDAANLRSVPLFASLDSKATAELGEYLTIHDYPKSATIFRNGDPGDAMSIIDGHGRSANATATENARLAKLTRDDFLSFMRSDPRVTLELMTALTGRLRRTDDLLRHRVSRNINEMEAARMTLSDRASDKIAEFGGSWKFIFTGIAFLSIWILVNSLMLVNKGFDPFPYILLNLALNMIFALQAPIIMMSQNRQAEKDRLRANL